MIQFNLLPDIKLKYLRVRRLQRLVMLIAGLISGIALAVFIFLVFLVYVWQKGTINNISSQIATQSKQIEDTSNLDRVLTVQNQLASLPSIDAAKPVTSRLFGYINQLTPANATISLLKVGYSASTAASTSGATANEPPNTMTITGGADTLATVQNFVDTLKFTNYTTAADSTSKPAFSDVVLTAFTESTVDSATYTITASFDPELFSEASVPTITPSIPPGSTTRAQLEQPTDLFQKAQPTAGSNSGGNQ